MAKCYFSSINFILILLQVSPSSSISEKLSLLLDENSNVYVCVWTWNFSSPWNEKKGLLVFSPDLDFNWKHLYNYHESDFCKYNNCLLNFMSWLPELESRDSETKKTYEFNLSRCELIFTRTNWQIWKKRLILCVSRALLFILNRCWAAGSRENWRALGTRMFLIHKWMKFFTLRVEDFLRR